MKFFRSLELVCLPRIALSLVFTPSTKSKFFRISIISETSSSSSSSSSSDSFSKSSLPSALSWASWSDFSFSWLSWFCSSGASLSYLLALIISLSTLKGGVTTSESRLLVGSLGFSLTAPKSNSASLKRVEISLPSSRTSYSFKNFLRMYTVKRLEFINLRYGLSTSGLFFIVSSAAMVSIETYWQMMKSIKSDARTILFF